MSISTRGLAFPKPGDVKKQAVRRGLALHWSYCMKQMGDRWVCIKGAIGRRFYDHLKFIMWRRQNGICCVCRRWMDPCDVSFEHQEPRRIGAGFKDDSIYKRGENGRLRRHNGVSHYACNSERGSKRTALWQEPYRKMTHLIQLWKEWEEGNK